jgi:predicted metalloprotease
MRWQGRRRSENVEDRRGMRVGRGGGVAIGGGTVLLIVLVTMLLGGDPTQVLVGLEQAQIPMGNDVGEYGATSPEEDQQAEFVSVVLADTEDTWGAIFADGGQRYQPPRLVLFTGAVDSACGFASAAVGPFYCPADRQVYIDLAFFRELDERFGAPGDFARAYVVAHEIGHHVQNLLGVADQVQQMGARLDKVGRNRLSVLQELQADCLAGVWGHHAGREGDLLESGDVEEGLAAASAIGDDTLQRQAGRRVQPESWTHGSSAQRVQWLRRGLQSGRVADCDTFE